MRWQAQTALCQRSTIGIAHVANSLSNLPMPLYWLCDLLNNQISVVIEPAHSLIYVRLRADMDEDEFTDDPTWRSAEWNDKQFRKSVRDGTSKFPQMRPVMLPRQPTNL